MLTLLLLIFLGLVFFFIIKFTTAVVAIIAIIAGTTTVTVLICVWLGTSYYLKVSGHKPYNAQATYRQLDTSLKQIAGDLREIRFELEGSRVVSTRCGIFKVRSRGSQNRKK